MVIQMPILPLLLAILTAFSMAGGQLLFKLGAPAWQGDSLSSWILSFLKNPFLVTAIFLYAITILIWIYVLRTLPLSLAYPLTALSYVIVPIFSYLFLHEKISWQTAAGCALIIVGVVVTHLKAGGGA
jgi:drug/metabolite transporter (DMT)-like permease